MQAQIKIPPKLIPVFEGAADVRGAWGGRGSAKTRTFAKMLAVKGYIFANAGITGQLLCARQYMNSLDESSLEECKRAIQDEPFLFDFYDIGDKYIKSKDGRVWFSFAGLEKSVDSIKSKGRILICWIDEAEPVTENAFQTLIPTLREEGSDWNAELWVTWNPKRKHAAVEKRYRNTTDPIIKITKMDWRDNPKFPAKLERERQRDLAERPDQYNHIWEGDYETITEGAVYAKELVAATTEGRITSVPYDSAKGVHAIFDLGRADKTSIWFVQQIGFEYRLIDFYENRGYAFNHYLKVIKEKPYIIERVVLPHDAIQKLLASERTIEQQAKDIGFDTVVLSVASIESGIDAARAIFNKCWFDERKCSEGLDALRNYRYEKDSDGQWSRRPVHDEYSHAADAFRYFATSMTTAHKKQEDEPLHYWQGSDGWMG